MISHFIPSLIAPSPVDKVCRHQALVIVQYSSGRFWTETPNKLGALVNFSSSFYFARAEITEIPQFPLEEILQIENDLPKTLRYQR